jgi:transcription elongation GreA/GreB family factor
MDKTALIRSVIDQLEAELALQTSAAIGSREEATDEESRAEDKYDMRSQSAAYLAAGQSRMAAEIAEALAAWRSLDARPLGPGEAAKVGALVTLEAAGRRNLYLFGPQSGGLEARDGSDTATVVTAASPLGRQLLGKQVGDTVHLPGRGGQVAHGVVGIA